MAPKRGTSVEPTDEHEAFMRKLAEYHKKRGTTLDTEPKVGVRRIDLWKLYSRVVDEGGYDLCSDTKAKPLMWRKLAEEFVGKNQYSAAQAFQIKNVYYKNLCAYEISTHWRKEPPPKEILEDVTAKGGNVMDRTMENYTKPPTKEELSLANGEIGEMSPEQQKTPKAEATDGAEDPGSATGRTTRGLRQAPPQRVLFQPDLAAGKRGMVPGSAMVPAGATGMQHPASLINGASATLANYEPSQSYPLSLKPVTTPANNPEFYRNERKRKAEANAGPLAKKYRHIMLPGAGFIGPSIYDRTQMALMSGVPGEEEYALHHLVKISHERGDKYRFDAYPGLAEALVKKVLQVSGLFYDVDWDVSYDEDTMYLDDETLDGLSGTSDVIRKLKSRIPLTTDDSMQDARFVSQLNLMTEAALVIRNMCLQQENAQYLVKQPISRDYLAVVLNLPQHPGIIELQHHALDTAEQLLVWCDLAPKDALYQSLLAQLDGKDRGLIITSLKTISRIAMNLAGPKRLDEVSKELLIKIQRWLLIEDEELRSACLDFLFQYTSFADNVDNLLQCIDSEALARQLSRLLLFDAKEEKVQRPSTQPAEDKTHAPVPRMSRSLVESLLKLDEPERSSEWLRMCFLSDKESEMTQISLWQAYQATFASYQATHPHLIAGDFIKNVSTTFAGATAQVAGANKYVIRGIRARKVPVDTGMLPGSKGTDKGKELHKCGWRITIPCEPMRDPITGVQSGPITKEIECGEWFKQPDEMLKHALRDHLQLPKKSLAAIAAEGGEQSDIDGKPSRPSSAMANHTLAPGLLASGISNMFDFQAADKTAYRCRWASCRRHSPEFASPISSGISRTALFARHVQTHLPETSSTRSQHNLKPTSGRTSVGGERVTLKTLQDEKGDAAGVALSAALVLRNIAKFMPVTVGAALPERLAGPQATNGNGKLGGVMEGSELMERVFDNEVRDRLFHAMTHGRPIHNYVGSMLRAIGRNSG
ncbi:hypothetical protein LTR08_002035 [Meristemomyces frigidus]|nr:hypothetical protein LTR08_002035 [Meristemomyces frigidus]